MPPVTEIQLQSFAAYADPNWEFGTNTGLYLHRGTVYVVGSMVFTPGFAPGSATILSGLPANLRPAADTAAPVAIDPNGSTAEYAPDSATGLGPYIPATVHTDGTWTFDGGNPVVDPDQTALSLVLSGARWDTADAISDSSAMADLSPYVGGGWSSDGAMYSLHDARFHLEGSLVAGSDVGLDPNPLQGLPAGFLPIFNHDLDDGLNWTEVGLPNGVRALVFPDVSPHPNNMSVNGDVISQNRRTSYSYSSTGYTRRGRADITVSTGDLGSADAGASWAGFSSAPDLRTGLDTFDGVSFSAVITITPTSILSPTINTGSGQFAYYFGMSSGATVDYKLVLTLNTTTHKIIGTWYRVTKGGSQTSIGGGSMGVYDATSDSVRTNLSVHITQPIALLPGEPAGTVYITMRLYPSFSDLFITDTVGGPDAVIPGGLIAYQYPIPPSTDGDGIFLGETLINASGEFALFYPGDVLDLSGSGWPLAYATTDILLGIV